MSKKSSFQMRGLDNDSYKSPREGGSPLFAILEILHQERRFELCPELCYSLEEVFLGWGGRIAHGTCDRGLHSQWNVEGGRQVR